MKISADFFSDWIEILRKDLQNRGRVIEPNWDKNQISNYYFNLLRRLVEPRPRNILKSKNFSCAPENVDALKLLIEKIEKGIDIEPHLSKGIQNLKTNDDLLNDWGIHHLHLGPEFEKNGKFVTRDNPLLYSRFDKENAYLINVYDHQSFEKQDIIRIIHNNWPETIESYRIKAIVGLIHVPSDEDIKQLRIGHSNTMIEIEQGVVYAPLGGGVMSSGISHDAVKATRKYHKIVDYIQNHLKQNIDKIITDNNIAAFKNLDQLYFKLQISNTTFFAVETQTQTAIDYGELS